MTEGRLPLAEPLRKAGDGDLLRSVAEAVLQLLMGADVEGLIGAGRHERSPERLNWRNGYREAGAGHPAGLAPAPDPEAAAPGLLLPAPPGAAQDRRGGPGGGDPGSTGGGAPVDGIGGVPTRRVDELVQAMGPAGIARSTVSKLGKDISTSAAGPS